MAKKVTTIPASLSQFTAMPIRNLQTRKVCGYARVSTEKEEQASSFETQMRHYTEFIQSRSDWEFVGMYSDEGISATSTAKREGFNQMIQDAMDGKIDLIITKSVSRFARNTVDSLSTIRKLKEHGVEVFFEEQNIYTFDSKGELLITIMSSLAQEESHSISDNTTWGRRKQFAEGKFSLAYSHFLGYDKGPDGNLVVNPEQAETVKLIYKLFLEGHSSYEIAKMLTQMGIPTPAGKKKWYQQSVNSILSNEKYKGDALLQKFYTVDYLSKKKKKNEGEIQQYYVEGCHEAIIEPEVFDRVQEELAKRRADKNKPKAGGVFAGKIRCGKCGAFFGRKVWHSNTNRKIVYRCNATYEHEEPCHTGFITEEEVMALFVESVNKVIPNRKKHIQDAKERLTAECETDDLEQQLEMTGVEINSLVQQAEQMDAWTQNDEGRAYLEIVNQYEKRKAEYEAMEKEISRRKETATKLKQFITGMEKVEGPLEEFDPELWMNTVDFVTVYSREKLAVTFKNGTEIEKEAEMEKKAV